MVNSALTILRSSGSYSRQDKFAGLLDIDRIKEQNSVYKCTVGCSLDGINYLMGFTGIYNSDSPFSVSVGAEYVDQFSLPETLDNDATRSVVSMAQNLQDRSQFILKSLRMTEQRWSGSTPPEFSVKIDIPIIRKTDACWTILDYLLRATSGTQNESGGGGQVQRTESAWQIFAPNGYHVQYATDGKSKDTPKGVHIVSLGSGRSCWFVMPQAIITNMDFNIGSKKYYDGNPTSVSCTIHFKFWRQPLYEDVIQWFPLLMKEGYR